MAVLDLNYLKTLFQTFDKPTEEDFSDLIDTLSTLITIRTYNIPGSGDIWTDVNNTTTIEYDQKELLVIYHQGKTYFFTGPTGTYGLGGIPTTASNFIDISSSVFTQDQIDRILDLITNDVTIVSSSDVSQFEKGVSTVVKYTATINHQEVSVNYIKLNGINQTVSGGGSTIVDDVNPQEETKVYTIEVSYVFNGTTKIMTDITTVYGYIPQFAGLSDDTDYASVPTTTIPLTKFIQGNSEISFQGTIPDKYIWFIVSDTNAEMYDQNGMLYVTASFLGDSFMLTKTEFIQLENGNFETVKFFRTLNKITTTESFKLETR